MVKNFLIAISVVFLSFTPNTIEVEDKDTKEKEISIEVAAEIDAFNKIIDLKLTKAVQLEEQAEELLKVDQNSEKAIELRKEAQLQRMMTLKYQAAIACRTK
ncbi:hypothetical protein [Aquimarina sp. 2201CG5-10]|uniref:hypothetical protein n=1 Tax=Aquimarina callyspongiae TaxID=3098150 RepID=UPI002AB405DD|nr:hypothetical protein [Aquimarina sp. 2201CG5-10]MDY8137062.1 hypothetical protein [Aquimarina sp. 2201CG5-10]